MMDAGEIRERIWRQAEPQVFISRREFLADLEGWDIVAREIDGDVAGATLIRGAEFHFVSFGTGKPVSPRLALECLQPILDRHGFVHTRTPKEDARQRRFNQRIGFRLESEDEFYAYFRLDRLNLHAHQERAACQSSP